MRRIAAHIILLLLLLTSVIPVTAHADTVPYFTFSLDTASAPADGLVKLQINANPVPDTAAGFRMTIEYDESAVSFVRTETSSQIKTGTMMTNGDVNPIRSVYVCNVDQKTAPVLSGNIISFVFKVHDDAQKGKVTFGAHIDQICNYQAKQLNLNYDEDLTLNIDPELNPSDRAYLTSLYPQTGSLTPSFSSDIFEYEMNVGYDVTSIEFEASAGSGGTVKINRKTLGRAGTDTSIIATVTSADKKAKVQYVVTVHRQAKPSDSDSGEQQPTKEVLAASGGTAGEPTGRSSGTEGEGVSVGKEVQTNSQPAPSSAPQAEAVQPGNNVQLPLTANAGGIRNIYIIGNQMPTWVVVIFAAIVLIELGMMLAPWLNIKPKGKG